MKARVVVPELDAVMSFMTNDVWPRTVWALIAIAVFFVLLVVFHQRDRRRRIRALDAQDEATLNRQCDRPFARHLRRK